MQMLEYLPVHPEPQSMTFFYASLLGMKQSAMTNWKTKCHSTDWKPLKLPIKKKLQNDTNSDKSNACCCFGGFTNPILKHYGEEH
jgi:hypothetical protein